MQDYVCEYDLGNGPQSDQIRALDDAEASVRAVQRMLDAMILLGGQPIEAIGQLFRVEANGARTFVDSIDPIGTGQPPANP